MSRSRKRLAAIRNNPREVRFEDLEKVLHDHGFRSDSRQGKGDHRVFKHDLLTYPMTIDPRRPHLLPVYVKNALKAIDEVLDLQRGR